MPASTTRCLQGRHMTLLGDAKKLTEVIVKAMEH